jgi:tRNA modification GTPase
MYNDDTICAAATAIGGALTVIRISGADALAVATKLWRGHSAPSEAHNYRRLLLGKLVASDGAVIDPQCLLVYMPAPNSYTGEDVVELQCHGGVLACRMTLAALQQCGARAALPGEFTRRAFINGKMDLTQAEAVADIIAAESGAALANAGRQLNGDFGRQIDAIYLQMKNILAEIESHLDFPEEELEWIPTEELSRQLTEIRVTLQRLSASRQAGEVLRNGITMVIAGEPNVGKSSLLNRWLGRDRAIVSDIPGTTRDTVEADFTLHGIPIRLVDTAGVRESTDLIEQCGIERTRTAARDADVVLWLVDGTQSPLASWPQWDIRGKLLLVANKCDIATHAIPAGYLRISAKTGEGLETLAEAVVNAVLGENGLRTLADTAVAVNARHGALLEEAVSALEEMLPLLSASEWELVAVPLRRAIAATGEIVGQAVSPDILDTIFHRFCIGK